MRVYVQENTDVYGIVYMLAPKNSTVHVRLIWLPEHLQGEENGVCHYVVQFEPQAEEEPDRNQWLDGLPELLINWHGVRHGWKEIPAKYNVLRIEHDSQWEFNLLIEMAKNPLWKESDLDFDIMSKVGRGVRSNIEGTTDSTE